MSKVFYIFTNCQEFLKNFYIKTKYIIASKLIRITCTRRESKKICFLERFIRKYLAARELATKISGKNILQRMKKIIKFLF